MSQAFGANTPLIATEGFYGLPVEIETERGPKRGTIEWLLKDEERHHGRLRRIEASLRDALNWTHSPSALPIASVPQQPVARDLVAITRGLVGEERSGAKMMRDLAQREKGIYTGLHSLLLEMMAMDSEKHARLLQFVQQRLESRGRAADGPSD